MSNGLFADVIYATIDAISDVIFYNRRKDTFSDLWEVLKVDNIKLNTVDNLEHSTVYIFNITYKTNVNNIVNGEDTIRRFLQAYDVEIVVKDGYIKIIEYK